MKLRLTLCLLLASAGAFAADSTFPGIQSIMSPEEYKSAGLDQLSPGQIALINAVIVRRYSSDVKAQAAVVAKKTVEEHDERGWVERFGLPDPFSERWKTEPSIKSRCTGWVGGNSFQLENGQIWEGDTNTITVEVSGKNIEIQARPGGMFALIVDGQNTTLRVRRIK